jgi:hypothetical protein
MTPTPGTRTTAFRSVREAEGRRLPERREVRYYPTPDAPGVWKRTKTNNIEQMTNKR